MTSLSKKPDEKPDKCVECWKPKALCVCALVPKTAPTLRVLVLQHPQEARNPLSTARMVSLALPQAVHRVGFSWGSLRRALGDEIDTSRWAVLFVGTKKKFSGKQPFEMVTPKGQTASGAGLEGIVVLDGTWKQSKTLWWRNPWLSKLKRISLSTGRPSLMAGIRQQPRNVCLCTLEAVSETLDAFGDRETAQRLQSFLIAHIDQLRPSTKDGRPAEESLDSTFDGKANHHSSNHRGGTRQDEVPSASPQS